MKKRHLALLTLASGLVITAGPLNLGSTLIVNAVSSHQQLPTRKVSLGATLDANGAQRTLQLLGATDVAPDHQIRVDGNLVNHYLRDGSHQGTDVYSSAIIEPREPGYGVQIQIVTPQTILHVTPDSYRNAAITSGARDVLIKIASTVPVTGEGALAGVYAIYEANGAQLNPRDIQVAQKEVVLPREVQKTSELTDSQINELTANIKAAITAHIKEHGQISDEALRQIIDAQAKHIESKYNTQVTPRARDLIFSVMKEFASLEISQETQKVLEDSNPMAWTSQQAIDLYEAAVFNTITAGSKPVINDYNRSNWQEVSQKDRSTLLRYGDLYYLFIKLDEETQLCIGTNPDKLFNQHDHYYVINNGSRLITAESHPNLFDGDWIDTPDQVLEYFQAALFPNTDGLVLTQTHYDPEIGYQEVIVDQVFDDGSASYLGSYGLYNHGIIEHLDAQLYSGYAIKMPEKPQEQPAITGPLFNLGMYDLLKEYMHVWGQWMGQTYQDFTPHSPGSMHGLVFPNEVLGRLAVNGQPVTAYWSEDGISNEAGDYAIVAAYNDSAHYFQQNPSASEGDHYYLFALVDGQPWVLFSQQAQASEDGLVHFRPTQNHALQAAFEELVATGTLTMPEVQATTSMEEPVSEPAPEPVVDSQANEEAPREEASQPAAPQEEASQAEAPVEEAPQAEESLEEAALEEADTGNDPDPASEVAGEEPSVEETPQEEALLPAEPVYDPNKNQVLADYMGYWSSEMGYPFQAADPNQPLAYHSLTFPNEVIDRIAFNQEPVTAYWSTDGISYQPGDLAIVAAYTDYAYHTGEGAHLGLLPSALLFAIIDGNPVVLATSQAAPSGDGYVHFTQLENIALQEAFKEIVHTGTTYIPEYSVAEPAPFDEAKSYQLGNLIAEWSLTQDTSYISYSPDYPGEIYGVPFPTTFIDILAVDGQPVDAVWAEDGQPDNPDQLAIVAAYSDAENYFLQNPEAPAGATFLLFGIYQGDPLVLASQQNQGSEDGRIHFYRLDDPALQQAFDDLVKTGSYNLP